MAEETKLKSQMSEGDAVKFTDEELQSLQGLQNTYASISTQFGQLKVNDLVMVLGKYYANVINIEEFKGEHNTYTILTKNDNFYADGVLVSSELKSK